MYSADDALVKPQPVETLERQKFAEIHLDEGRVVFHLFPQVSSAHPPVYTERALANELEIGLLYNVWFKQLEDEDSQAALFLYGEEGRIDASPWTPEQIARWVKARLHNLSKTTQL